jgi:arylsulfatase A-like enzyme
MIRRTAVFTKIQTGCSSTPDLPVKPTGFISMLLLSAWCGLIAGLLEAGTIAVRKQVFDPNPLFRMSRHYVWLIPLSNVCVFLTLGLFGGIFVLAWPRRGRWLFTRGLCALTLLPALLVAFPQIYGMAWIAVALGVAAQLVPRLERNGWILRRFVVMSLPAAIALLVIPEAMYWVSDGIKERDENARPLPPPGSPNVLVIVMDSVAAGHLGLHGYSRATSTTLAELAERGVRFDSARAACSWTLPSHATMFTGRWLHELSVGWLTPLDHTHTTLAEFLGDRGYATAGFVGNTWYCAADSGLARGFVHYQDYILPGLTAFKMAVLVSRAMEGLQVIVYFAEDWLESAGLLHHLERLWRSLASDRKGAAVINRALLDWLSQRGQPNRPFFAFLNYFDAHYPYQLSPGRPHRYGVEPADDHQRLLINHWWDLDKSTLSPKGVAFAVDAYDDCIADLDEQVGKLVDELERRGILDETWLIITSDHGESFGEHEGVFCHGTSLYETELHVPLVVVPPGGRAEKRVVRETVSLRDLAATVVELSGLGDKTPFPGVSLARFWKPPSQRAPLQLSSASPALAEVVPVNPLKKNSRGVPQQLPPLGAVKEAEWSYIRQDLGDREELFNLRADRKEGHNLAGEPAYRATLQEMRKALSRLTGGPLLPERLSR